jgi:hypothetical protein
MDVRCPACRSNSYRFHSLNAFGGLEVNCVGCGADYTIQSDAPAKIGDPADRDADGQFQPAPAVHRAGYGDSDDAKHRLFRLARAGGSLYAGEGKKLIDHYEGAMRAAIATGDAGLLDEALRFGKD